MCVGTSNTDSVASGLRGWIKAPTGGIRKCNADGVKHHEVGVVDPAALSAPVARGGRGATTSC